MSNNTAALVSETDEFRFCAPLAELMTARQLKGRTGKKFEGLAALSSRNNLVVLRNLCLELKPKRTLEIGLSFGGSCLVFTSTHRDLGHAPERQHVALDPFQVTVWDDCGLLLTEQAGLSAYLDFRPAFSSLELPALLREGRHFDLVYIDGSHLFEDVFVDAYFIIRLLDEGGVVAFDDSTDPHVAKVLRFLRANLTDQLQEIDLSVYRPPTRRGFSYRLARRLGKVQLTAFRRVGPPERDWNAAFHSF
jgi:predicted O-methyltransferase YrrM